MLADTSPRAVAMVCLKEAHDTTLLKQQVLHFFYFALFLFFFFTFFFFSVLAESKHVVMLWKVKSSLDTSNTIHSD